MENNEEKVKTGEINKSTPVGSSSLAVKYQITSVIRGEQKAYNEQLLEAERLRRVENKTARASSSF